MTIASAFLTAANSSGATAKERFSQGRLLKNERDPDVRKGICGGLSLTFLGLYAASGAKSLTAAQDHSATALLKFSTKLQYMVMAVPTGVTTVAQAIMVNFCKAAPVVGLRGEGLVSTLRWPCIPDLTRLVSRGAGEHVIALPNHYVAVSYDGTSGAFFDPNAGAAYCPNSHALTAMLTSFFTNPEVATAYECAGNEVHVMPLVRAK